METIVCIVAIKYSPNTKHFFIDFSDGQIIMGSVLISQIVAESLSKSLHIKIMEG